MPDNYSITKHTLNRMTELIRQLKVECNQNHIPMFITMAIANNEEGTEYYSDMVMVSTQTELTDDKIKEILLMFSGFPLELPPRIKRALRDLQDYAAALDTRDIEPDKPQKTPPNLHTDRFPDIARIMKGDERAVVPKEACGDTHIEEFYDD